MQAFITPGKKNTRTASNRSPLENSAEANISLVKKAKDNFTSGTMEEGTSELKQAQLVTDYFPVKDRTQEDNEDSQSSSESAKKAVKSNQLIDHFKSEVKVEEIDDSKESAKAELDEIQESMNEEYEESLHKKSENTPNNRGRLKDKKVIKLDKKKI